MAVRRKKIVARHPKSDTAPVPTVDEMLADSAEAEARRDEASKQLRDTFVRGFDISRMVSYFSARRQANGFGESIEITFTPRRNHAS